MTGPASRTPRRSLAVLLGAATAASLLSGCGGGGDRGAVATAPTDAPTSEPAPPAPVVNNPSTGVPAFPADTRRQRGRASDGASLVLTGVRTGRRDGYDRVVMEFSGRGTPGWVVDYRRRAVQEGSGDVIDVAGDRTLQVVTSPSEWPAPDYYDGPQRIDPRGDGTVEEVYVGGTFEGYTQLFVGLDDRAPFRVFTLSSPTRLVVDVADS